MRTVKSVIIVHLIWSSLACSPAGYYNPESGARLKKFLPIIE